MRLKHTISIQAAHDTAMKRKLFSDDTTLALTDVSGFQRLMSSLLDVAPEVVETLTFADVTIVKGLYLEVDGDAKVRLNGSQDYLQLRVADGATMAKLFIEADITQVTVENPSTSDAMSGLYVVWGDPEA